MDASKFSVIEAEKMIRPFYDKLTFRRLSDWHNEQHEMIGGQQYSLIVYDKGSITAPFSINLDSMCYVVRVSLKHRHRSSNPRNGIHDFHETRLIFVRDGRQGVYSQQSYFRRAPSARHLFHLHESHISTVRGDTSVPVEFSSDLAIRFWEDMRKWVEEGTNKREAIVENLRSLGTKCLIEKSKYEAAKLIENTAVIREAYAKENRYV